MKLYLNSKHTKTLETPRVTLKSYYGSKTISKKSFKVAQKSMLRTSIEHPTKEYKNNHTKGVPIYVLHKGAK